MKKSTLHLIVCFILPLLAMWLLHSCGKRITSTTHYQIKKDSLKIDNSIELTQNATFNDIGSVRPFDILKPMLYNGKWYYNTIIEFDKSIKKGIEIKANNNLSYNGSESKTIDKETVKTDNSNLYIGLSFVIGILFVLYLSLKKHNLI